MLVDRFPKIWLRPRPFWGKIIHAPAQIPQCEATRQIWSLWLM